MTIIICDMILVEIHFTSSDLSEIIIQDSSNSSVQKTKALIFPSSPPKQILNNEYLTESDSVILWQSVKKHFDQQNTV